MTVAVSIHIENKVFPAAGGRDAFPVLRDIKLEVDDGSFVVVTGPSGCGKSTLLNVVAGLDDDYAGRVEFGGRDPRLSYMFQSPRLLPWRTIYENVALVLGDDEDEKRALIPEMIARVGLTEASDAFPERTSLGMQRRAALARAFIVEPEILLMDEPFVSLDDPSAQALRALLLELWSRRPTTVLFVTHDRMESVRLATRLIRFDGCPASVVQDSNVLLSQAERADTDAVMAEKKRLFGAGVEGA